VSLARICLLTPGHLATNPRLVKEADALSAAGYDVRVICAHYIDWGIRHDAAFSGRPWSIAARVPFGPLAPRGIRIKQVIRQRAACAVLAFGLGTETIREAAWHPAAPDITSAALAVKADLYVAHYPAALPAAAKAAAQFGSRYAFDAEDFHLGDLPDLPEHEPERQRLRAIEARYLPGAAYVSAAAPGIADAYAATYPIDRPTVILNVFPIANAPPAPTSRGTAEPGPSLYWFSQTIGPDRGLETAVTAIGLAKSQPHLYLRGRPVPGFIEHLKSLASNLDVVNRIHILPIEAAERMERLAAGYDVGLVAETVHSRNRAICLTNKLFSFLLAGLPPMISATPGQKTFAASCGLADLVYEIGDAEMLAQLLDETLGDPLRLAKLRATCFALGQDRFNWERESHVLFDRVAQCLGGHVTVERAIA
jgi:hypothetical protein